MKKTNRLLSLLLALVMVAAAIPGTLVTVSAGGYEDGEECWNCGHYHWGDYMCEDCGGCSGSCTDDWCALDTHCHRCGGCLRDKDYCDECNLCEDCMKEMGHCTECDMCWMDYGGDDTLCGNCRRCEFCSTLCEQCGLCEDCANDSVDGMHCPDCGNCYQITEQCMFVENNHCKECCVLCEQCEECIAGDHLQECPYCGLCVECCEFNSMMEGCEDGDVCVADSDWLDHVCEGCGQFFNDLGELCETCGDADVVRCNDCCELASECSEAMCEYDEEYEDHFCIDCGACFHDTDICSTCEDADELRCRDCCARVVDSMGCDGSCGEVWCCNDTYFEDHLTEAHNGEHEHDAAPSNRWSFDETEHWRECRFCSDDTPEDIAEEHKEETAEAHKLDGNNKCVVCGYTKGSKVAVTRQPKSVSAKVSDWNAAKNTDDPYNIKNNTVTLRTAAKLYSENRDATLGYNWCVRVVSHEGSELFNGYVEDLRKNLSFDIEYEDGAVYNGFDSPELTISVPYRACQWKYIFSCEISVANDRSETISTLMTEEVQLKANHLYSMCLDDADKGPGAAHKTITYKNGEKTETAKEYPSDGHKWYCVGCDYTDSIMTAKGKAVMHRYGSSAELMGESVATPGARVYKKVCKDCRHATYYETHEHVFYDGEDHEDEHGVVYPGFLLADRDIGSHTFKCLVEGCEKTKKEDHVWRWEWVAPTESEAGRFFRTCNVCDFSTGRDLAAGETDPIIPRDEDGDPIAWDMSRALVTAHNATASLVYAKQGDKLTLTITANSETFGKKCVGWTVEYTTPDKKSNDVTSAYTGKNAFTENADGAWETVITFASYSGGGIFTFTPKMEKCTDHSYVIKGRIEPKCMYDGFEGYSVCKYCGAADPADTRDDEARIIPAVGTEHTGKRIKLYEKEVISPTGKKTVTWTADINKSESKKQYNYIEGDCSKNIKGCEGDFLCSDCGRVIPGKRELIHSDELDWIGEITPTCGRNGYSGDGYCKDCKKFIRKGDVIDMGKGHYGPINYDYDHNEKDPTCTEAGKTSYQFCYTCMERVADGLVIPPLGHKWVKDEANSTKTVTAYKCERAGCTATKFDAVITKHGITVVGGTAYVGGKAVTKADEGESVILKIGTIPAGKRFKEWEAVSGSIVIKNAESPNGATFVMGAENVEINAVLEDIPTYDIIVTNGTAADGTGNTVTKAECGTVITVTADPAETGKKFDKWVVIYGDVAFADAGSSTTSFTMPAESVKIKATYKDAEAGHMHIYNDTWKSNDTEHWKECADTACKDIPGSVKDKAAHTSSDWIIDSVATDTADGAKHKECTVCRKVLESAIIPASGSGHTHAYGDTWKADADNHWHECECGDRTDKTAHSFIWKTDKEATKTETGIKHEECSVCGTKRSEGTVIAKLSDTDGKGTGSGTGSDGKGTEKTADKPAADDTKKAPQTGDDRAAVIWLAMLLISGGMAAETFLYFRKRKNSKAR